MRLEVLTWGSKSAFFWGGLLLAMAFGFLALRSIDRQSIRHVPTSKH
jgi:hypothetical protein